MLFERIMYSLIGFTFFSCLGWAILVDNPSPPGIVFALHTILISFVFLGYMVYTIYENSKG